MQQGAAPKADAVFITGMSTYLGLLAGHIQADGAIADGLIRIDGDSGALSRFLNMCSLPEAPNTSL